MCLQSTGKRLNIMYCGEEPLEKSKVSVGCVSGWEPMTSWNTHADIIYRNLAFCVVHLRKILESTVPHIFSM